MESVRQSESVSPMMCRIIKAPLRSRHSRGLSGLQIHHGKDRSQPDGPNDREGSESNFIIMHEIFLLTIRSSAQLGDKFIEIVCPLAPQKDVECRTLADQYADDLIEAVTYEYLWPEDFCAAIGLC